MNIFAIVVYYNGKKWIDKCLGSILSSKIGIQGIVIDNASTDGGIEYIKKNYPNIIIIPQNVNLGFAKANNIGIKRALDNGADYVFLLNQDAWIEQDTIEKCLNSFYKNADVGVVSPMHLDGTYTGFDWGFLLCLGECQNIVFDLYKKQLKPNYEIPFVNAAAWLLSKECIQKVGGFDTLLFTHRGEDNNYIQRVFYHGFRVLLNTESTICHDRGSRHLKWSQYPNENMTQQELIKCVELGDINENVDIEKIIKDQYRIIVYAFFKCNLRKVKQLRRNIALLEKLKVSRTFNREGNMVWLNDI